MSRVIILDSGPLGLVAQRHGVVPADTCRAWVGACVQQGARIMVPAVADDEVRRELLRTGLARGLEQLDTFNVAVPVPLRPISVPSRRAGLLAMARRAHRSPRGEPIRRTKCEGRSAKDDG